MCFLRDLILDPRRSIFRRFAELFTFNLFFSFLGIATAKTNALNAKRKTTIAIMKIDVLEKYP